MAADTHWVNVKEVGYIIGMRILFNIHKLLGPLALRLVLYPVVAYYYLSNSLARNASRDYLKKLRQYTPDIKIKYGYYTSFLHFVNFANCAIDKLGVWSNSIDTQQVQFNNQTSLQRQINARQGVVLLGSHIGNLEVCRCLGTHNPTLRLNIIVHTKHAEMFNHLLEKYSNLQQVKLIEVTELTPATAMLLNEGIGKGEFVVIVGDRISSGDSSLSIQQSFLGHNAHFPQGPFILASLLKCPVYTLFGIKKKGRYQIYVEHFADQIKLPRKQRALALATYIAQYAAKLEEMCALAPLQWFNFYPFWKQPPSKKMIQKHYE